MFVSFTLFPKFLIIIDYFIVILNSTGVEVSSEDIELTVNEVFEENKNTILELRYRTNGQCLILNYFGNNFTLIMACLIMILVHVF